MIEVWTRSEVSSRPEVQVYSVLLCNDIHLVRQPVHRCAHPHYVQTAEHSAANELVVAVHDIVVVVVAVVDVDVHVLCTPVSGKRQGAEHQEKTEIEPETKTVYKFIIIQI